MCLLKSCFFKENWNSLNLSSEAQSSRGLLRCGFSPPFVIFWKQRNLLKATSLDHLIKIRVRRIAPGWRAARCVEKWHQCKWARDSHGWAKCDQMHLLLPCIFTDWAEGQTLQTCFSRVCCHCHYQVHIDASIVAPVSSKALLCTVSLFYLLRCLSLSSLPLSHFLFLLFDKTLNVFFSILPWHLYINI